MTPRDRNVTDTDEERRVLRDGERITVGLALMDHQSQPKPGGVRMTTLCAHPDLISLDAELGQVYETKLATLQGENRKRFTEEQRHWIITRNAACGIPTRGTPGPAFISEKKPCLLSHIRSRIEAIRKT